MKRILLPIFTVIFLFSTSCVQADSHFSGRDSDRNHYSWRPTDESQSKQAVGMVIWGISIAVFALVLSAIIPNSAGASTPGTPPSGGGSVF